MDILLGILLVVFGLIITFMGLQVFFATLPMLGFLLGFFAGSIAVQGIFGDSFLSTSLGWIVGIALGILVAAVSWFWWYAGALLAAGSFGAVLGSGIVAAFGGTNDWLLLTFGVIGFALAFIVALRLDLPVYIIIFNTGFAGASILVTGLLLVFNQVDRPEVADGTAAAIINENWLWLLVAVVVGTVGILAQLQSRAMAALPQERWAPARAA